MNRGKKVNIAAETEQIGLSDLLTRRGAKDLRDMIEERYHEFLAKNSEEPKYLILDAKSMGELQNICRAESFHIAPSIEKYKGLILCEKRGLLSKPFIEVAG